MCSNLSAASNHSHVIGYLQMGRSHKLGQYVPMKQNTGEDGNSRSKVSPYVDKKCNSLKLTFLVIVTSNFFVGVTRMLITFFSFLNTILFLYFIFCYRQQTMFQITFGYDVPPQLVPMNEIIVFLPFGLLMDATNIYHTQTKFFHVNRDLVSRALEK